jgi:hypothetical protein
MDHNHATFNLAESCPQCGGDVDRLLHHTCHARYRANFNGHGNGSAIGDVIAANCNITTDGDYAAHRDCFTTAHGYAAAN